MQLAASFSIFSLLFHAYLILVHSTSPALGQSQNSDVFVYVNDTGKWSTRGNWTLIHVLDNFADNWLLPNTTGSDETSVSISFAGTAVVLFGTVVNGTQGQPMSLSVQLDSDTAEIPTYTPGTDITASGVDNNNKIFNKGALPYQVHTLKLTVTGTTSFFLRGILYNSSQPATSSSASIPVGASPSSSSTTDASNSTNDTPKLAGAIGGGVGALILVGIVILCMVKRVRRIEENEKKLQAIPFLDSAAAHSRSHTAFTPTATVRSVARTGAASSTAVDEKIRLKEQAPTAPSSSRSYARTPKSQRSPAASLISIPSEFQHATTVVPAGTAVASSYIGTSPLPPVGLPGDAPPMPPMPADVKHRTKSMKRREKQEKQERQEKQEKRGRSDHPSTPSSGLGLFSNDSVNTLGSTGSALSRPLPLVPGTRSSAPSYNFPPEKVGLSPPPARRRSSSVSKREKRPLPLPESSSLPPSR
ncbi:hypothetical protein M408DRAFT_329302 [Serendipita vermifera MAFF 305830]|uniref:Mid2 domain-containing protein n=1 Tax=Serendipita vermifera MAFF 305830 TaxID=933852 RepID=A0A0C3B9T6_SERVB|nr:hypothetical protein M408DRAFT_329302 [Serendipita vermifera MAFF 305830]